MWLQLHHKVKSTADSLTPFLGLTPLSSINIKVEKRRGVMWEEDVLSEPQLHSSTLFNWCLLTLQLSVVGLCHIISFTKIPIITRKMKFHITISTIKNNIWYIVQNLVFSHHNNLRKPEQHRPLTSEDLVPNKRGATSAVKCSARKIFHIVTANYPETSWYYFKALLPTPALQAL